MNFNEIQSKSIYEFIMSYNSDEEFRNIIHELYEDEVAKISILHIYALEEILRYGNKGIFNKFLQIKGNFTVEEAVNLFDGFIKLLNEDANFKEYKMIQLKTAYDTLSVLEKFAFSLISTSKTERYKMHKEMCDELEYDDFNPILYATDNQIRRTLENLFFGQYILQILELPVMKPAKVRQKEIGLIANMDKEVIIRKIQELLSDPTILSQFKQVIDNRFIKAKIDVLLGKGEAAFAEYAKYNTNISTYEIFGIEKDNTENLYEQFVNMINKSKNQDSEPTKKR